MPRQARRCDTGTSLVLRPPAGDSAQRRLGGEAGPSTSLCSSLTNSSQPQPHFPRGARRKRRFRSASPPITQRIASSWLPNALFIVCVPSVGQGHQPASPSSDDPSADRRGPPPQRASGSSTIATMIEDEKRATTTAVDEDHQQPMSRSSAADSFKSEISETVRDPSPPGRLSSLPAHVRPLQPRSQPSCRSRPPRYPPRVGPWKTLRLRTRAPGAPTTWDTIENNGSQRGLVALAAHH